MTIGDILSKYLLNTADSKKKLPKLLKEISDKELQQLNSLTIKDYTNNNGTKSKTGFCAIAFEDPDTKEVGMSFRGAENLGDWDDNQIDMLDNGLTSTIGVSPQSLQALRFFEKNKNTDGENYLYGHSKGGDLAMEV